MQFSASIQHAADLILGAEAGVAFTGAGISTESGIPDFRSPNGVWANNRQILFDQYVSNADERFEYWRQKCEAHRDFAAAQPNSGHQLLADWQSRGNLRGVVTQNIDGLHEAAGNHDVLELHGTARKVGCLSCDFLEPSDPFVEAFLETQTVPKCPDCGGLIKHATVSFGQSLPANVLYKAAAWSRDSDVYLALGSSLVVTPAADLPRLAVEHHSKLIIINRNPTPLDSIATIVINADLGETLTAIEKAMRSSE